MSSSSYAELTPALRRQSLWLGLLALVIFVLGDLHQSVIGFDSRFVLFAQEMLRNGPSFFPTTYGVPYPDYSATSTLFIYLLSLPLGEVNSLTAWLPTSIASAVLVTLLYRLLAPYSPNWALASVALTLCSMMFVSETRAVSLDQMLATVAFAVFYLGYAADHLRASRRLGWVFALLVLGFAIRGPIGLVVPTGMLCSYYLLSGQWRRMLGTGFAALVLLGVCIGLLLWAAYITGGDSFIDFVLRRQITGRIDGSEGVSGPFYYFSSSVGNYALAYPLAILVLIGVGVSTRRGDLHNPAWRLLGYSLAAGLIVMIGLSIPMAKKSRYMLPMLPMAAIIAGYPFQATGGRMLIGIRRFIQALWLVLPGLLIAGMLLAHRRYGAALGSLTVPIGLLAILQAVALLSLRCSRWRVAGLAGSATLALWSAYTLLAQPFLQNEYDTRQFSQAVYHKIQEQPLPLVLQGLTQDGKAIKFMVSINTEMQPLFTQTVAELQAIHGPAYVMVSKSDFALLPVSVTGTWREQLTGRFDKEDFLLLRTAP